jgi:aquaporin Z
VSAVPTTDREAETTLGRLFLSELAGTAALLLVGLSVVILMWGDGGPGARLVPDEGLRRAITGFLFGTTGGAIALSPVGKASGAHINPAVTLGFWLMGKISAGTACVYVAAQLVGAALGCVPLLAFGPLGQSVAFGATLPGAGTTTGDVLLGEAVTTLALVVVLCVFLGFRGLRGFTPFTMPVLYSVMVFLESPVSGTSTNPARSFGPSLVSGRWDGWWLYWVGPLLGTLAAAVACSALAKRIEVAKLCHFETGRDRLLRRDRALT